MISASTWWLFIFCFMFSIFLSSLIYAQVCVHVFIKFTFLLETNKKIFNDMVNVLERYSQCAYSGYIKFCPHLDHILTNIKEIIIFVWITENIKGQLVIRALIKMNNLIFFKSKLIFSIFTFYLCILSHLKYLRFYYKINVTIHIIILALIVKHLRTIHESLPLNQICIYLSIKCIVGKSFWRTISLNKTLDINCSLVSWRSI